MPALSGELAVRVSTGETRGRRGGMGGAANGGTSPRRVSEMSSDGGEKWRCIFPTALVSTSSANFVVGSALPCSWPAWCWPPARRPPASAPAPATEASALAPAPAPAKVYVVGTDAAYAPFES